MARFQLLPVHVLLVFLLLCATSTLMPTCSASVIQGAQLPEISKDSSVDNIPTQPPTEPPTGNDHQGLQNEENNKDNWDGHDETHDGAHYAGEEVNVLDKPNDQYDVHHNSHGGEVGQHESGFSAEDDRKDSEQGRNELQQETNEGIHAESQALNDKHLSSDNKLNSHSDDASLYNAHYEDHGEVEHNQHQQQVVPRLDGGNVQQVTNQELPIVFASRLFVFAVVLGLSYRNRRLLMRHIRRGFGTFKSAQFVTMVLSFFRKVGTLLSTIWYALKAGLDSIYNKFRISGKKPSSVSWSSWFRNGGKSKKKEEVLPVTQTSSSNKTTNTTKSKKGSHPVRKDSKSDEPNNKFTNEKRVAMEHVQSSYNSGIRVPSRRDAPTNFTSIVSDRMLVSLIPELPERLRFTDLSLLFASDVNGYNLQTAYKKCAKQGPFLLAVMDSNRYVFGAFSSVSLNLGPSYYGTGESFMIQFGPDFAVHRWTGMNQHILISNDRYLAFGGGGCFALWLDESFDRGTSHGPSETFGNPPLASQESFKVVSVEIWGFTNPMAAATSKPSSPSRAMQAFSTLAM